MVPYSADSDVPATHVYYPSREVLTTASRGALLSWLGDEVSSSLFMCSLRQWRFITEQFPNTQGAMFASAQLCCPFAPLLKAIQLLEQLATPEAVLTLPVWVVCLLHDYFCSFGRAIFPLMISDDLCGRKVNLVMAKLLYDGLQVTQPQGETAASPAGPVQGGPERRTLVDVQLMEKLLLADNPIAPLNIAAAEEFCPIGTEQTIVVLRHQHASVFGCAVVTTPGAPLFLPVSGAAAAVLAAAMAAVSDHVLPAEMLRDLDLSCVAHTATSDTRITQLDAIVVDCSGSMSALAFEHDKDMSRSDAAQILFNMLVDKYRALEIHARVACVLFGSTVLVACPFTHDLQLFEALLGRSEDMGQTRLWDAVLRAVELVVAERSALQAQGLLHPACRARIVAMTDGVDNASAMRLTQAARYCRNNSIVLDAFVLGPTADTEVRVCAAATGGFTLAFRDIEDASELFEHPTVVNTSARPARVLPALGPSRASLAVFEDLQRFPRLVSATARVHQSVATATGASAARAPTSAPSAPVSTATATATATATTTTTATAMGAGTGGARSRRLEHDLRILQAEGPSTAGLLSLERVDTQAGTNINIVFRGAAGSLYANSGISLSMSVPADYPFRSPTVIFNSALFHPQILPGSRICDDQMSAASWTPRWSLMSMLVHLRQVLDTPDTASAINSRACDLLRSSPALYEAEVRRTLPALALPAAD